MQIRDISEEQLIDIFMLEYPPTLSLDECRERLELEITMMATEQGDDIDSEESTAAISPAWVYMALWKRRDDWVKQQTPEHISALAKRKLEQRKSARLDGVAQPVI